MLRYLWLSLVVVALDQLSKAAIAARFELGEQLIVTPFFNLVRAHNSGAAFSFLASAGGWQRWFFITLAAAAVIILVMWLRKLSAAERNLALALALLLGGALGNVIDRIWLGYVLDFVQVHYAGWVFPAFNVADSAITLGVIILLYDSFFSKPQVTR